MKTRQKIRPVLGLMWEGQNMPYRPLHLSLLPASSNIKTYGDVVYTATTYYPPDVVEAWKLALEKRLRFLGVVLWWEYIEGGFVQVKTLADPDDVIDEMTIKGFSLEAFASHTTQTH